MIIKSIRLFFLTFEHVKVLSENDNVEPDLSPDIDIKIYKVDNVFF